MFIFSAGRFTISIWWMGDACLLQASPVLVSNSTWVPTLYELTPACPRVIRCWRWDSGILSFQHALPSDLLVWVCSKHIKLKINNNIKNSMYLHLEYRQTFGSWTMMPIRLHRSPSALREIWSFSKRKRRPFRERTEVQQQWAHMLVSDSSGPNTPGKLFVGNHVLCLCGVRRAVRSDDLSEYKYILYIYVHIKIKCSWQLEKAFSPKWAE